VTAAGVTTAFTYDANGNMLTGLGGKIMSYDGENRPLSVTHLGKKTCYVYGADGTRRKKIENFSPAQSCDAPTAAQPVTLYVGQAEIRNWGQGNAEEILLYPVPSIRISLTKNAGGAVVTKVSTLHLDALGSVRAVTNAAGLKAERALFRPFGEESSTRFDLSTAVETKGFIGERFDGDAGLQYLNARYYDPKLAMFIQPDWWEVTRAGVGTNRYSYSFNDPVNRMDPAGNGYSGGGKEREKPDSKGDRPTSGLSDYDRQREGWHDSDFDWSKGSNSVRLQDGSYLTGKEYDALKAEAARLFDAVVNEAPGAATPHIRSPVTELRLMNSMLLDDSVLRSIVTDPRFTDFVIDALVGSNYLSDISLRVERVGHIYVGVDGTVKFALLDVQPGAMAFS
jgi:RHS repeat-associated protein